MKINRIDRIVLFV